jgi:nucleoside-diphosphate-sugar epimerase
MVSKHVKMTKIAILGATSQIAKDLIVSFSAEETKILHLFARSPDDVKKWLNDIGLSERYLVDEFGGFGTQEFDVIINFVGVGNPAQAAAMGSSIFDVTLQYDELALNYVRQHPECRYVFLSSGAAYGSSFDVPVDANTKAVVAINNLQPQDWYGVAKLHAECRHRSLAHLPIVDIRVFNYFSHTQDMEARFLITDIVRAIRDETVLKTSADYIVRDYIGADNFYQLVIAILASPATNDVVDCYSHAPIDKPTLLAAMQEQFGLQYEIVETNAAVNVTGTKPHYYSLSKRAGEFGYRPGLSSMDGLLIELNKALSSLMLEKN